MPRACYQFHRRTTSALTRRLALVIDERKTKFNQQMFELRLCRRVDQRTATALLSNADADDGARQILDCRSQTCRWNCRLGSIVSSRIDGTQFRIGKPPSRRLPAHTTREMSPLQLFCRSQRSNPFGSAHENL